VPFQPEFKLRGDLVTSAAGVYAGSGSNPGVRDRVEESDLVLSIGAIKSDFNTVWIGD
jgi:TPP-dependent 2-oxoacid decarboxylase